MGSTLLGPLGNLRTFLSPPPHTIPVERATSRLVTLGGVAKAQRALRAPRRASWPFTWGSPDQLRELIALEQGVYGQGPFWWYDPMAARLQMLPTGVASPGLGGDELFGTEGTATLVYATAAPFHVGVTGTGEGESPTVPAIVGRDYVAAAEVSADARIGLRWIDSAGATLSTDYGSTGITRRTVTATAPASTVGVQVILDPTSGVSEVQFSSLQLTEGDTAITWEPGPGMARWSFAAGLQQVYQAAWAASDTYRRDLTVELVEVG